MIKGIWVLRWTAIIAALVYVGLNLVRTVRKALEGQVVVSLMEKDLHEYLFPSITICSKYKDGNSDILPILWLQSWNGSPCKSGLEILPFSSYFEVIEKKL